MRVCVRRKAAPRLRTVWDLHNWVCLIFCGRSYACRWSVMACVCGSGRLLRQSESFFISQFSFHQFCTDQCSIECVTERARRKAKKRIDIHRTNTMTISLRANTIYWLGFGVADVVCCCCSCVAIRALPFWRLIKHFRFTCRARDYSTVTVIAPAGWPKRRRKIQSRR